MGNISLLTSVIILLLTSIFLSLTDIRIKGSMWKCIQFWWKGIPSNHNLRWIPRIHLVLQDLIQVFESIFLSEQWTFINRFYLILVRTNERHCSCAVVCYAQWAECLLLHDWYQDNRPTVWMGKCIFIFWIMFQRNYYLSDFTLI